MKKFLLLPASLFFFVTTCFAQISDSLYKALPPEIKPANKNILSDSDKAVILKGISHDIIKTNHTEVYQLVSAAVKKISTTVSQHIKVGYAVALGNFYITADQYPVSAGYYKDAIKYAGHDTVYNKALSEVYANLASLSSVENNTDSAMAYLGKALEIGDNKDSVFMCNIYAAYQITYTNLNLFYQALDYAKKYLDMMPAVYAWGEDYISTYIEIADLYALIFHTASQKQYLDSSKAVIHKIMDKTAKESTSWYGSCYFMLGRLYEWNSEYKQAISYLDSALQPKYLKNDLYDPRLEYLIKLERIACLTRLGNWASVSVLNTLPIFEHDYPSLQQKNEILYNFSRKNNNWKSALEYYENYVRYKDSLDLVDNRGRVFEVTQKYSVAQKEVVIQSLENKNLIEKESKNRITIAACITVSIMLLIIVLLYAVNKRKEARRLKEKQKMLDEINFMEQEIEFNHLQQQAEKEAAVIHERKAISQNMHDEVSSSLAGLSYLISHVKKNMSKSGTVSIQLLSDLEEEARTVYRQARDFMHALNKSTFSESYNVVELLKKLSQRFSEVYDLRIIVEVDEDDVNTDFKTEQHAEMYRVVKEAVTNSIKHSGADTINIKLTKQNDHFHFAISDNGKGMKETQVKGMGMANMRKRIEALKGTLYVITNNLGTQITGSFPVVPA